MREDCKFGEDLEHHEILQGPVHLRQTDLVPEVMILQSHLTDGSQYLKLRRLVLAFDCDITRISLFSRVRTGLFSGRGRRHEFTIITKSVVYIVL